MALNVGIYGLDDDICNYGGELRHCSAKEKAKNIKLTKFVDGCLKNQNKCAIDGDDYKYIERFLGSYYINKDKRTVVQIDPTDDMNKFDDDNFLKSDIAQKIFDVLKLKGKQIKGNMKSSKKSGRTGTKSVASSKKAAAAAPKKATSKRKPSSKNKVYTSCGVKKPEECKYHIISKYLNLL